ncbi:MAG: hypothetical protein K8S13_10630 [Desulfobacula sp.]|uniref:hypothetical protein n=1 Tax=Desulfobacula sp. TaxID=2593537 RepID=UPI0025B7B2B7|nr:hypothetical protein [Desulfobacula sp.]MCD4720295.1 hypothetical protein [Desulfobacula sp.]
MSSIPNQSLMAGLSPRQNTLPDAQFLSYIRKQSFSAYESLDAGLTIKTKEGDLVTLTSHSYAEVDAFMYDSKGVLQTDSGKAVVTQNIREITLTSGESFTFSVVGDLSEEELGDIEAIVKGIDEIISQMAAGDMNGAVAKAISMGGYDSVSMYAADITYQRSYAMASETRAETVKTVPETEVLPKEESNAIPSVTEPFPENHKPRRKSKNTINNIDKFVDKMTKNLEKFEEKLVDKAQKPIDKLFRHHLEDAKKSKGEEMSTYNAIDNARKQIEKLIDQMTGKIFKDNFSAFF